MPYALWLWAPASYRTDELLGVCALVLATTVPYAFGLASVRVLLVSDRTRTMAGLHVLAAMSNIGLNLVWVPRWGLVGAALATLVAYVLLAVALGLVARREIRLSPPGWRLVAATSVTVALLVLSGLTPVGWALRVGVVLVSAGFLLRQIVATVRLTSNREQSAAGDDR